MSFEAEVEVYGTCDRCGKSLSEGDPTYCEACAGPREPSSGTGRCLLWMQFADKGEYWCGITHDRWKWEGPLPPYCPMCGRPI